MTAKTKTAATPEETPETTPAFDAVGFLKSNLYTEEKQQLQIKCIVGKVYRVNWLQLIPTAIIGISEKRIVKSRLLIVDESGIMEREQQ